jgi:solute carrier family 35 (UDP-xylose/UDP-N-acetylglucosamine transporter), member B4
VFVLTTECSSLTVTLVLTLRKFTSLIISIIYFNNPFTITHWIGTIMVFFGTLLFTNFFKIVKDYYYYCEKKSSDDDDDDEDKKNKKQN